MVILSFVMVLLLATYTIQPDVNAINKTTIALNKNGWVRIISIGLDYILVKYEAGGLIVCRRHAKFAK